MGSGLTPQQEPNVSLISRMLQLERRKVVKSINKNTKMAPRALWPIIDSPPRSHCSTTHIFTVSQIKPIAS
jgi:hypothetical protein